LLADLFTLIGIVPLDQRNYENVTFNTDFNVYASVNGAGLYASKKVKSNMAKRIQKNP